MAFLSGMAKPCGNDYLHGSKVPEIVNSWHNSPKDKTGREMSILAILTSILVIFSHLISSKRVVLTLFRVINGQFRVVPKRVSEFLIPDPK